MSSQCPRPEEQRDRMTTRYWVLGSLPAQYLEFVKARGALPDVSQQLGEAKIGGTLGEFEKHLPSGAADALRIREVLVHHSIECVQKLFFGGLQFAFP